MRGGRFVEPFVGGFNILPALGASVTWAFCSDAHPGLIQLYQSLQAGWTPPTDVSEDDYHSLRLLEDWTSPLTAFAAFGLSYGGKEWGGFARTRPRRKDEGREGEPRDYGDEARRALLAKVEHMRRVNFLCRPYERVGHDRPAVVYCDPPYAGTTGYGGRPFDHDRFYHWCQNRSAMGDIVLVSEFTAPQHWEVLWEQSRAVHIGQSRGRRKVERLYLARPPRA